MSPEVEASWHVRRAALPVTAKCVRPGCPVTVSPKYGNVRCSIHLHTNDDEDRRQYQPDGD